MAGSRNGSARAIYNAWVLLDPEAYRGSNKPVRCHGQLQHRAAGVSLEQETTRHIDELPSCGQTILFGQPSLDDQRLAVHVQSVHPQLYFRTSGDRNLLTAIWVSSDRERNQFLYEVRLADMIAIFEQVGTDYPNSVNMTFDSAIGDYKISALTMT
jgi:hypothetical protein